MDKVYEDVKGYINAIAENLGVAAEHVYGLLVKQQVIEGVTTAMVLVLALVLVGTIFWQAIKRAEFNGYDIGIADVVTFVSGFLLVVVTIASFAVLPEAIMKIFNPEYYAIKEIMDVFKGGQ